MNFTSKIILRPLVIGTLMLTAAGLIREGSRSSIPGVANPASFAGAEYFQAGEGATAMLPAVLVFGPGSQTAYYQPVSAWYKNKHWWKRNAPIVGGAGGGALVGGLVGGGAGAVIGGAVGGGGGYLYKRSKHHHHHHY